MDPITLRAAERILAVACGGLAIYLGYRQFCQMPELAKGEGRFQLPGGVSIYVSRVGPRVFFSLFGAFVLAVSFYQSIVYSRGEAAGEGRVFYGGAMPDRAAGTADATDRGGVRSGGQAPTNATARLAARLEIEFLGSLPGRLTELYPAQAREVARHVRSLKLQRMQRVWGPDWGDPDLFRLWAEGDELDPVPAELAAAAAYYRSESSEGPSGP